MYHHSLQFSKKFKFYFPFSYNTRLKYVFHLYVIRKIFSQKVIRNRSILFLQGLELNTEEIIVTAGFT